MLGIILNVPEIDYFRVLRVRLCCRLSTRRFQENLVVNWQSGRHLPTTKLCFGKLLLPLPNTWSVSLAQRVKIAIIQVRSITFPCNWSGIKKSDDMTRGQFPNCREPWADREDIRAVPRGWTRQDPSTARARTRSGSSAYSRTDPRGKSARSRRTFLGLFYHRALLLSFLRPCVYCTLRMQGSQNKPLWKKMTFLQL